MWEVLLLTIVLVGIGFALLSINILIKKNGKFPNSHIGGNKAMQDRGITCATTQHKMAQKKSITYQHLKLDKEYESRTTSC